MGACLGSCIGSCVASCACAACCKCCECKMMSGSMCAHRLYVLIITLGALASLVLRYSKVNLNVGFDLGLNGISTCTNGANSTCGEFSYVHPDSSRSPRRSTNARQNNMKPQEHQSHSASRLFFRYSICSSDACQGFWAVYRISFSLACFFFAMTFLTMCTTKASSHIHRGFW